MRTSDPRPAKAKLVPAKAAGAISVKTIALEALAASALAVGAAAVLSPRDVGLATLYPHPIWLAVALLAARYGSRGLGMGVLVGWSVTALLALVMRAPLALVVARTTSGPDLGTLLGVVMVAWIASIHERRAGELTATVASLKERCAEDHEMVGQLRTAAVALRARADRLDTSLTFLRDVASRLEGRDPVAAAQAALDFAMARSGARAGLVAAIGDGAGGGLGPVASSGTWANLPDLQIDRTAMAALRNRRATRAVDISDGGSTDSDLAAPIFGVKREMVGLIVLRGVHQGGASSAALHDLALIADWCGQAISSSERGSDRSRGSMLITGAGGGDDADRAGGAQLAGASSETLERTLERSIARINI
jgi:hypothetical protein